MNDITLSENIKRPPALFEFGADLFEFFLTCSDKHFEFFLENFDNLAEHDKLAITAILALAED